MGERGAAVVRERAEHGVDHGGTRPDLVAVQPVDQRSALVRVPDDAVPLGLDHIAAAVVAIGRMNELAAGRSWMLPATIELRSTTLLP